MSATEKILQIVSSAKQTAENAEREFDYASEILKIKSGSSINLFGGDAVSCVADIASESRRICDSLYATNQMLVKMLDEECRPLLDQNPDYHAVREVRNLIKQLNDDSEIENNFTASLNSHNLGGVASGRYLPSIENKMIQSYWETKCDTWPGGAEMEEAERLRVKKEKELRKSIEESKYDQEEAVYREAYAKWKTQAEAIEQCREEALSKAVTEAKAKRVDEINNSYASQKKLCAEEKQRCEKEIEAAQASMKAAGLFQFGQKQKAKKTIEEMRTRIDQTEKQLAVAERTYQTDLASLEDWIKAKQTNLRKEVAYTYPLPPEPERPYFIRADGTRRSLEEIKAIQLIPEILEYMLPGVLYSVSDLRRNVPGLSELTNQIVSATMRNLVGTGQVKRVEENRKTYYCLGD